MTRDRGGGCGHGGRQGGRAGGGRGARHAHAGGDPRVGKGDEGESGVWCEDTACPSCMSTLTMPRYYVKGNRNQLLLSTPGSNLQEIVTS